MLTKRILPATGVVAVMLITAGPVRAGGPSCGATLAPGTETTLTADLECLPGPFVLTVDSATLNLNGFRIVCLNQSSQAPGVVLTGKRSAITGPGDIIGCDPGVVASGEGKHTIRDVQIDSAQGLTVVAFSDKNLFTGTILSGEGGIRIFGDKNLVIDSQVSTTNTGVDIFGSKNRVTSNQLTGNDSAVMLRAEKNKLVENTLTDPGSGVTIEGAGHLVLGNTITSAELYGIRATGGAKIFENGVSGSGGIGIDVSSPPDAKVKVSENDVTGSGGVDLFDAASDCGEHKWSRNTFGSASPEACIE